MSAFEEDLHVFRLFIIHIISLIVIHKWNSVRTKASVICLFYIHRLEVCLCGNE